MKPAITVTDIKIKIEAPEMPDHVTIKEEKAPWKPALTMTDTKIKVEAPQSPIPAIIKEEEASTKLTRTVTDTKIKTEARACPVHATIKLPEAFVKVTRMVIDSRKLVRYTNTQSKAAKKAPSHPPASVLVVEAVTKLNEKGGSSLQAIKKSISESHKNVNVAKLAPFIKKALIKAVKKGTLLQPKGKGAAGSFKLGVKPKAAKKKKPKVKKPKKPAVKVNSPKPAAASPKKADAAMPKGANVVHSTVEGNPALVVEAVTKLNEKDGPSFQTILMSISEADKDVDAVMLAPSINNARVPAVKTKNLRTSGNGSTDSVMLEGMAKANTKLQHKKLLTVIISANCFELTASIPTNELGVKVEFYWPKAWRSDLAAEILELVTKAARDYKSSCVIPHHLEVAIRSEEEVYVVQPNAAKKPVDDSEPCLTEWRRKRKINVTTSKASSR
ncbi:unnamed protein product [Allacma fusca]|uniref:H15 domain-containing protein n=1 Tax=Allacma fusca TaxID=39272 RepID=A0A8J2LHS8_9HEXA|nr:unnamed protein product [Allacma fusca]